MATQQQKPNDWFAQAEADLAHERARNAEREKLFSPDARQVVATAGQAARALNQNYVGAEHLLAGLLKLNSGAAIAALTETGLTLSVLKAAIEANRGSIKPMEKPAEPMPFTPRCKGILERARTRARGTPVEAEDVLLELLCERDGLPARLFRQRGIDAEKIKQALTRKSP